MSYRATGLAALTTRANTKPARRRRVPRSQQRCHHCGQHADWHLAPPIGDDQAWEQVALLHAPDCEWVQARAWQVSELQLALPLAG